MKRRSLLLLRPRIRVYRLVGIVPPIGRGYVGIHQAAAGRVGTGYVGIWWLRSVPKYPYRAVTAVTAVTAAYFATGLRFARSRSYSTVAVCAMADEAYGAAETPPRIRGRRSWRSAVPQADDFFERLLCGVSHSAYGSEHVQLVRRLLYQHMSDMLDGRTFGRGDVDVLWASVRDHRRPDEFPSSHGQRSVGLALATFIVIASCMLRAIYPSSG